MLIDSHGISENITGQSNIQRFFRQIFSAKDGRSQIPLSYPLSDRLLNGEEVQRYICLKKNFKNIVALGSGFWEM